MGCGASAPQVAAPTTTPKTAASNDSAPKKELLSDPASAVSSPIKAVGFDPSKDATSYFNATRPVVTLDDVFSWLKWSPSPASPAGEALRRHFPGAMPGTAILHRTDVVLKSHDPSLTADNVLHGQSLCPDEINHHKNGLAALMAEHWGLSGDVFPMGGIGGAPYVGTTGFGAFSHHVRAALGSRTPECVTWVRRRLLVRF